MLTSVHPAKQLDEAVLLHYVVIDVGGFPALPAMFAVSQAMAGRTPPSSSMPLPSEVSLPGITFSARSPPGALLQSTHAIEPKFQDCIGAIDGTHVRVKVSATNAARYRGRKNWPTQNVLAACSFDLKFTYVMSGWEGTASDSRIIKSALIREDGLKIPNDKYYLADGGFMLKPNLLTPYRGVCYHLKEYSQRGPENKDELFNNRHLSLRNVIKRAFGVVKKRFSIIARGAEEHYSVDTMSRIIIACCILHNFVMTVDPNDGLINEVDRELLNSGPPGDNGSDGHSDDADASIAAMLKERIASEIWNNYVL